jgi:predicted outer membrane repeat protein
MRWSVILTIVASAAVISGAHAGGVVTACAFDAQTGAGLNLRDAVAGGGRVTFNCSGTIRVTRTIYLPLPVEIDGGGRVTLHAEDAVGMFSARQEAAPSVNVGTGPSVSFSNITLSGARRVTFGGIFSGPQSELIFTKVRVEGAGYSPGLVYGLPGGMVITANSITVRSSSFRDNFGAVLVAPTISISGSRFDTNHGSPFLASFVDEGGTATVTESAFTGNATVRWWGTLMVSDSTFSANGIDATYGGALSIRGGAKIETTKFNNNNAANGGAIWFGAGDLSLRRVVFQGNRATGVGGAIGAADSPDEAHLTIRYTHFRENQAAYGGAITLGQALGSEHLLVGYAVNFARNVAADSGGAIYAATGSVKLARATLVENHAAVEGGAIFGSTKGGSGTMLANALLVRNTAAAGGAYSGSIFHLVSGTIADNQGTAIVVKPLDGGQSQGTDGAAGFKNTVLLNNSGGACSAGAPVQDLGQNVQYPDAGCGASIPIYDPGLDIGYVPIPGSPIRFAGDDAACLADPVSARDVFGKPRPQGVHCTIGAVEGTIEDDAIRALRHAETPGPLADFLKLLDSVRRPKR